MADGTTLSDSACEVLRLWPAADADAFRDGLAKLASGVAVVTCWSGGQPRGLLVSSLTGLSMEPPRLLFCVRKASASHLDLIGADAIGVSLLEASDRDEAERFCRADRAVERFSTERWRLDPQSPPELGGALAAFAGPVRCRIDAGTHTVFILDVSTAQARDADPLLYFGREFRALDGLTLD